LDFTNLQDSSDPVYLDWQRSATMTLATEPFPQLSAFDQLKPLSGVNGHESKVRPRRKSSGLGGEIRAGDTAPALATWDTRPPSPVTPVTPKVSVNSGGSVVFNLTVQ
jgi:hypothetical protein